MSLVVWLKIVRIRVKKRGLISVAIAIIRNILSAVVAAANEAHANGVASEAPAVTKNVVATTAVNRAAAEVETLIFEQRDQILRIQDQRKPGWTLAARSCTLMVLPTWLKRGVNELWLRFHLKLGTLLLLTLDATA